MSEISELVENLRYCAKYYYNDGRQVLSTTWSLMWDAANALEELAGRQEGNNEHDNRTGKDTAAAGREIGA